MRTFSDLDKKIIESILAQDSQNMEVASKCLRPFLPEDLCVVEYEDFNIDLIADSEGSISASFSRLVEIISLMDYLESTGYIYCLKDSSADNFPNLIINKDVAFVRENASTISFKFNDNEYRIKDGAANIVIDGVKEALTINRLSDPFRDKVSHYFNNYVYKTEPLQQLKADKYDVPELKNAKRSLVWTRISLIIALLVPILIIPIENACSKTTICEQQYNRILSEIANKDMIKQTDTISEICTDTIKIANGDSRASAKTPNK